MDSHDVSWQLIERAGPAREVEHAPPAHAAAGPAHRPGVRRMIGTLVLAAGLLAVGGVSVVAAASPAPSAATTPTTTSGGSGMHGPGSMPGGCQHTNAGSGGSNGGSSPSTSPGA